MGKILTKLSTSLKEFIQEQQMFFVATAPANGKVNLSPKGMDTLRILGDNRVIWLNLTGSGNETAAHVLENNRMTIMFCSFMGNPLILRLYGTAKFYQPGDADWETLAADFPPYDGQRQIFEMEIESVQTSCGYAVPFYEFKEQRTRLEKWAADKGESGIHDYWEEKNKTSLDGMPTGIKIPKP